MYVIITYDAAPRRGSKLLKFLRHHLIWIQNSIFEGEVTVSQFARIKAGIEEIINEEKDSVIYYKFDSLSYSERGVIGIEKNENNNFI